jgi:hypothetical protein
VPITLREAAPDRSERNHSYKARLGGSADRIQTDDRYNILMTRPSLVLLFLRT